MKKDKDASGLSKSLRGVERAGDILPHPVTLFMILAFITMIASWICAKTGVAVTYKGYNMANGKIEDITVKAFNLLSADGLRLIVSTVVSNFTSFFAMGTVFTVIVGVSIAEGTGFLEILLRKVAAVTPKSMVTAVVVFLGVMSNVASSTGYVVLVPLGAILFMAFKKHPIAGLAAAYAGVSGGWTANLLIGSNDPLYAAMSTSAAKMLDPNYTVLPVGNWYFMLVSTFLVTIVGTIITEKVIIPRLGPYDFGTVSAVEDITPEQKRGLRFAGISTLVYIIIVAILVVPSKGILRNPETGSILKSPFMNGIVFVMMLLFMIPGIFYGIGAKIIKNDKDVVALMNKGIAGLSSFLVIIFFAAQFTGWFNASRLGTIISVAGANFLESIGFVGIPLLVVFILFTAIINIFIPVDTAKWAIMAPIFIPMMMRLGLSPELTQIAFRIGDSSTNIITPLMPFFTLTVAFFQKYDSKAGMGTVVSTMMPYSLAFLFSWIAMFIVWYLIGLPLGPGASLFYALP